MTDLRPPVAADASWLTTLPEPFSELPLVPDDVHQDVLAKADAGAALVYAIYHHPQAIELLKTFGSKGFLDAYGRAQVAYGLTGARKQGDR